MRIMLTERKLPQGAYKAFLLTAAAIWGLGTVVIKDTVDVLTPSWIVGIRFFFAGLVLAFAIAPRLPRLLNADHLKAGGILGVVMFFEFYLNSMGLTDTTASKSSFLTSTYCVIMPFLAWLFLKIRPTGHNIVAAIVCVVGVGCVSLTGQESLSLGYGDTMTLLSALFVGLHVVCVAKFAEGRDMLVLTCIQFFVAGIMGIAWGTASEPFPNFFSFTPDMVANLAYLALLASCLTLVLQNVGLAHVDPAPASLFLATESMFGVLFAAIFLGESLTVQLVVGFALIFCAILISEYLPARMEARRRKTGR